MKTKLADLGLGFVSLLLVAQVLWLSYFFATTEEVHRFFGNRWAQRLR